ncbi:GNAT family N-acetyltransferase [Micrococcales bacterium 31B]|nr:GNAT family N-acetyltransferase [Micrococcales bacterium 31B]
MSLRVPRAEDAAAFHALFDDPEVMRYIGDGSLRPLDWYVDFVARQRTASDETGVCLFAIRVGGETVGFAGVQRWSQPWGPAGEPEIGWRLGRAHWGRGFATAAARESLGRARALGIEPFSMIHVENAASMRVAGRLGGRAVHQWAGPAGLVAAEFRYA